MYNILDHLCTFLYNLWYEQGHHLNNYDTITANAMYTRDSPDTQDTMYSLDTRDSWPHEISGDLAA